MFNSHNEFLPVHEPEAMYSLVASTMEIPVTKVILRNAGHGFYWDRVVDVSRGDTIDTANDPSVPDINLKSVLEATADYLLAHL